MAQSNGQLIRDLYSAFAAGDVPAVLATFHPQIVWMEAENIPYADRNPYLGPQAIAEGVFGRIMTEWGDFTVTPEKIVEGADAVVAMGRYRGIYKATSLPLDAQFVHVWTIQDGQIVAFQQYADTAQFARVCNAVIPPPSA